MVEVTPALRALLDELDGVPSEGETVVLAEPLIPDEIEIAERVLAEPMVDPIDVAFLEDLEVELDQAHVKLLDTFTQALDLQTKFRDLQQRGALTVVAGLPAAGKSTKAREIAEASGALLIDKDEVNPYEPDMAARMAGGRYDRDSTDYQAHVLPVTTSMLATAVRGGLDGGQEVVLDAPLLAMATEALVHYLDGPDFATRIRQWLGIGSTIPVRVIWMTADSDTRRERMKARGARRDAGKVSNWANYESQLGPVASMEAAAVLSDEFIDTSND